MLNVTNLKISFADCAAEALRGIAFSVAQGEVVGIVGESGSGKSLTALAVGGLLPPEAFASGQVIFQGRTLRPDRAEDWCRIRGREIGMVFQEPAACLNPLMTAGELVSETIRFHTEMTQREAEAKTLTLFAALGIHPPRRRAAQFPHQLSGGLKQRVMLAAAICCDPPLLLADEPTTALDVTVQAQILRLLRSYVEITGASLLLISHDLGVIAQLADRVLVMCEGLIVEEAPARDLFVEPAHPYTQLLLASVPRLEGPLRIPAMISPHAFTSAMCGFAERCALRGAACVRPPGRRTNKSGTRAVRCHYPRGEFND
ncbi:MAG: ABC transporter ATP-binding protein [Bacillota bacterium]|nr:ABC transporter ATP-binding protein [Bacillota bacterium]MDW7682564.1 ABC transporter ATP-binding protein [Bacillota bacterium]